MLDVKVEKGAVGDDPIALKKLVEAIRAGCGVLYEPVHVRRMAKARADEVKLMSAATTEAAIESAKSIALVEPATMLNVLQADRDFVERMQQRLMHGEMRRQTNIDAIVAEAAASPPQPDISPSAALPDEGWLHRFFDAAAEIDEHSMQQLWGKVLAGETTTPGRFSRRTLDVLRNLSNAEAQSFAKLCSLVWGINEFVVIPFAAQRQTFNAPDEEALMQFGWTKPVVQDLAAAGLLTAEVLSLRFGLSRKGTYSQRYNGKWLKVAPLDGYGQKPADYLHCVRFTQAGREIGTLVPDAPNDGYVQLLAERMKLFGLELTVHESEPDYPPFDTD